MVRKIDPWGNTGALVGRVLILVSLFAAWEWLATSGYVNPILVGRPSDIFRYLYTELFVTRSLFLDMGWTLLGVALAFSLGTFSGIAVGMLFVTRPFIEALFGPFLTALNAMPRLALAPLFLIWFGLGLGSKIAVGFSLSFFVVLAATVAGGRSVSADHITLAKTLGATEAQIFRNFTLPSSVPVIFAGLRLGLIVSLLGVVGAEIIASEHGLGQTLSVLAASFQTSGVFGVIILLSLFGVGLTKLMDMTEQRLLRWR